MEQIKTTTSEKRWNHIDLLECLGILFVIMYHSTTYNFQFLEKPSALFYMRYYLQGVLSTCVPLFFFANGYLLLNRKLDLKKHIIKSVKIVILTFVWGIVNVFCLMYIENEYLSAIDFIKYVWTWHQGWINYLWYMGALICLYVFFPLLKIVFESNRKVFLYFTIIVAIFTFGNTLLNHTASATLMYLGKAQQVTNFNFFNMFNPFKYSFGYTFVYFCLGGIAYDFKDKIESIAPIKRNTTATVAIFFNCLILFALGIVFSKKTGEIWDVVWNGYDTIPTLINVCSIFVLSLSYKRNIPILRRVSCNTLGIYFIHGTLLHIFAPIVKTIPILCTYFGCICYAVLILLIGLAITGIIKKIPFLNNMVKI